MKSPGGLRDAPAVYLPTAQARPATSPRSRVGLHHTVGLRIVGSGIGHAIIKIDEARNYRIQIDERPVDRSRVGRIRRI